MDIEEMSIHERLANEFISLLAEDKQVLIGCMWKSVCDKIGLLKTRDRPVGIVKINEIKSMVNTGQLFELEKRGVFTSPEFTLCVERCLMSNERKRIAAFIHPFASPKFTYKQAIKCSAPKIAETLLMLTWSGKKHMPKNIEEKELPASKKFRRSLKTPKPATPRYEDDSSRDESDEEEQECTFEDETHIAAEFDKKTYETYQYLIRSIKGRRDYISRPKYKGVAAALSAEEVIAACIPLSSVLKWCPHLTKEIVELKNEAGSRITEHIELKESTLKCLTAGDMRHVFEYISPNIPTAGICDPELVNLLTTCYGIKNFTYVCRPIGSPDQLSKSGLLPKYLDSQENALSYISKNSHINSDYPDFATQIVFGQKTIEKVVLQGFYRIIVSVLKLREIACPKKSASPMNRINIRIAGMFKKSTPFITEKVLLAAVRCGNKHIFWHIAYNFGMKKIKWSRMLAEAISARLPYMYEFILRLSSSSSSSGLGLSSC